MQKRTGRDAGSFLFIERWCCNVAGKDNLIVPSSAEARKNGRKGGIASAKARKEKKALKDTLEELLKMPIEDGKTDDIDKIKSIAGAKGKNVTMQEAIMLAMLDKAVKGDVKAAEYVRDTIGQKPSDKMKLEAEVSMNDKLQEVENYIKGKWSDG
jgi:hypothetical protein